MLLACPNCTTTYEVKAAVIGEDGRSLRCARCHHVWFATRSQELVFADRPVEANAVVEPVSAEPESPPAPSAPDHGATAPLAPDLGAATSQEIAGSNVEAPPLAPTAPPTTPSSGRAALSAEGEDIETFARRQAQMASTRAQRLRAQFGPP